MIDFSNARNIVTPKGEVAIIARGDEILWRKQTENYKRELAYLESDGHQYIDTGIKPDDTYGYMVEIEQIRTDGEQCPVACMDAGNRFVGVYFGARATGTVASSLSVGFGSYVKTEPYSAGFSVNQRVISSCNYMNDRKIVFSGYEIKDISDIHINGIISHSIHLFNRHYSSSAIFNGRIYSAVISKGGEVIADFIPVLDLNDVPCMYDKVSGGLFYNQGTGEFAYGEIPTTRLPAEYQEVEYIEGTGTQWIDTGVTINTATDDVEFIFQNTESAVYKWFFGEHDNNARFGLGSGDGANKRNVAYGNSTYKVTDTQIYNSQHTFTANQSGVFIDEAKIANFASFKSSSTLYLFSLNLNGGNYAAAAKVWSYKHIRNGALIRDLVPCYRKSDGKGGMYDLVTEKFYENAGTGEFLYA